MSFHILLNEEAIGNTANTELDLVPDSVFTGRNNHLIISDPWDVIAIEGGSLNAQRLRFNVPKWNPYGRMQVQPINGDADVPSNPQVADFRGYPLRLPRDTEIALEATSDLGCGTEDFVAGMWLVAPGWSPQMPQGLFRSTIRATVASFTTTADAWSAAQALVFDETLEGGTYAVVGAVVFTLGPKYYRLIFPRMRETQGRRLRPGGLCQQDPNEIPLNRNFPGGEWGRFHTFEQPTIEIYSNAAAAETPVVYLDVIFLGDREVF